MHRAKEKPSVCELGFLAENVYVLVPKNSSDNTLVELVVQIFFTFLKPQIINLFKLWVLI